MFVTVTAPTPRLMSIQSTELLAAVQTSFGFKRFVHKIRNPIRGNLTKNTNERYTGSGDLLHLWFGNVFCFRIRFFRWPAVKLENKLTQQSQIQDTYADASSELQIDNSEMR